MAEEVGDVVGFEFSEIPVEDLEGSNVREEPKNFQVFPILLRRSKLPRGDTKLPDVGEHDGRLSCHSVSSSLVGFVGSVGFIADSSHRCAVEAQLLEDVVLGTWTPRSRDFRECFEWSSTAGRVHGVDDEFEKFLRERRDRHRPEMKTWMGMWDEGMRRLGVGQGDGQGFCNARRGGESG